LLQAILFDLDGTLLDTEPDFTLILNRMLENHGRPQASAALVRRLVSAGAAAVVRGGFALPENAAQLPVLLAEFLDLYAAQIPRTRAGLFTDIDLVLATLHERSLPWGIMTNKARRFSEPLLNHFESLATCATLVCPDDTGKGKPDPSGLLLACSRLALPPAKVLYVGDHPRDIEAAHRAGMPAAAVAWGYLPEENPIAAWGAQYLISTPPALLDLHELRGHR